MNRYDMILRWSPRRNPASWGPVARWGAILVGCCLLWQITVIGPAVAQSFDTPLGEAKWEPPTVEDVQVQLIAWMVAMRADEDAESAVARLWPEDATKIPPDELLERTAQTIARVDPRAAALVSACLEPRSGMLLPETSWLEGDDVAPFERQNLRLFYGRWLVHEQLYDEALLQLSGLGPSDVVDPATLLFCQAVVDHRLLRKQDAMGAIDTLLSAGAGVPRRYRAVAELMRADLGELEEDSLDHIARRMDDIRRRLDLGSAGPKVRSVERGVIESLDKMIKQIEQQQQQQQQSASSSSMPSGKPAEESRILGGSGAGDVGRKSTGQGATWGDLPPKQREEALQSITQRFPAHYRDVIEQYFRKLAEENSGASESSKP